MEELLPVKRPAVAPWNVLTWREGLSHPNALSLAWYTGDVIPEGEQDPVKFAVAMKALPPNQRVAFDAHFSYGFFGNVGRVPPVPSMLEQINGVNSPWQDQAASMIAAKYYAFFSAFKTAGGDLAIVVLDDEFQCIPEETMDPTEWATLMADPRWGTNLINGRTLKDWAAYYDVKLDGPSITDWNGVDRQKAYCIATIIADHWRKTFFTCILARYFPHCVTLDSGRYVKSAELAVPIDGHGVPDVQPLASTLYTNCQGPEYYNLLQFAASLNNVTQKWFGGVDMRLLFNQLRLNVNDLRACKASSNLPVIPWIGYQSRSDSVWAQSEDYYTAMVKHLVLNAGLPWVMYFDPAGNATDADDAIAFAAMADLQANVKIPLFQPILKNQTSYADGYIVSAVEATGGHPRIAYVTFAPGVSSATFTIEGKSYSPRRPADNSPSCWLPL